MRTAEQIRALLPSLIDLHPGIISITFTRLDGRAPSSISIMCESDQDTQRVALSSGVKAVWTGNQTSRWLAADGELDGIMLSVFGPAAPIVKTISEAEADARIVADPSR